jgi:Protein of unknown function (DUF4235)
VKIVFTPVSIVLGLLAGIVGQKIFEKIWGLVDDQEPPSPEHREFSWPKLIAALLVEGAIFRLVKGLTDHGARRAFAKSTGAWPGQEAPEKEWAPRPSPARSIGARNRAGDVI